MLIQPTSNSFRMRPNHSVKPTRSGLRPPRAAYLKRWAPEARSVRHNAFFHIGVALAVSLQVACSTVQTRASDRYLLTDKPLLAPAVSLIDARTSGSSTTQDPERGARVPDSNLEPPPPAYIASEVSRILASDPKYARLLTRLKSTTLTLVRFEVHVRARDGSFRTSPLPGLQAIKQGVNSLVGALGVDPELVIDLELTIDGRRFSKQATWSATWTPPEHATVFPSFYVVSTVLDQMNENTQEK